jgi:glycerol dehydrogenase-like iron-containing ADH family enzyme
VTKALALQISNETSPPVKTLITSSHGVVPSVSFPTSPTAEGSESPGLSYGRCTERTLLLGVFPRRLLSDLRFTSGDPRYAP